jgi:hypothetical protein
MSNIGICIISYIQWLTPCVKCWWMLQYIFLKSKSYINVTTWYIVTMTKTSVWVHCYSSLVDYVTEQMEEALRL